MSKYSMVDYRAVFYALLGLSFVGPHGVNTFMLALALIASLLKFHKEIFLENLKKHPFLWASALLFLWYLASMLWSENQEEGWAEVGKKVCFLLIPFILAGTRRLSDRMRVFSLWGFIIGTIAIIIAAFTFSTIDLVKDPGRFSYYLEPFTWEYLAYYVKIQPIYLSLFTITAFFFLFIEHVWSRLRIHPAFVFLLVIFALFILLLSSRMETMVFVLVFAGMLGWKAFRSGKFVVPLIAISVLVGASLLMITNNPIIRERFSEMVDVKQDYRQNKYGGRGLRVQKWLNSIECWRQSPVVGVGLGDDETELFKTYQMNNFELGMQGRYNSHNQYLQTAVATGLVGLAILLALIFLAFRSALKQRNVHALIFISVFVLSCLTESMFERQWGILLFSFYTSFLILVAPPASTKG